MPAEATSMGVSLDGVMVPMTDGDRKGKREQAKAKGKSPSGPSGYQEVGCGTISFYDRDGERLLTRRMGRMPASHKATLKSQLTAEIMGALIERPGLKAVKLVGAWELLKSPPSESECLEALRHISDEELAEERQRVDQHRQRFRFEVRSVKSADAQLDRLYQQWLAIPKQSTG